MVGGRLPWPLAGTGPACVYSSVRYVPAPNTSRRLIGYSSGRSGPSSSAEWMCSRA